MLKLIKTAFVCFSVLLLTQCKNAEAPVTNKQKIIEMHNPIFADEEVNFRKWIAGVKGGGSGITMTFGWNGLPENLVMKEAYFRNLWAPIENVEQVYIANFNDKQNMPKDMIMHGDVMQEAINTSPKPNKTFPVTLTANQVGLIYEESGKLAYTIINNPIEKSPIALPVASPQKIKF